MYSVYIGDDSFSHGHHFDSRHSRGRCYKLLPSHPGEYLDVLSVLRKVDGLRLFAAEAGIPRCQ